MQTRSVRSGEPSHRLTEHLSCQNKQSGLMRWASAVQTPYCVVMADTGPVHVTARIGCFESECMVDRTHVPWMSDAQARVYWPLRLNEGVGKVDINDGCQIQLPPHQEASKRRRRQMDPNAPPAAPAPQRLILSTKIPFVTPGETRFTRPLTVKAGEDSLTSILTCFNRNY